MKKPSDDKRQITAQRTLAVNPNVEQRLGATPVADNMTYFRVWAPRRQSVTVELGRGRHARRHALTRTANGYFAALVPQAPPNTQYRYLLDDHLPRPDPASAYQPTGVHGRSQVIDHQAFPWTDQGWRGVPKRDLVIYELHVGAFTKAGTFRAAIERLPELLDLGATAVEIMPVAQSPGRWNWGYDGVDLFAVRNTYGTPDDFKALIDACHQAGLAVILDVVYNHLGPEGNYLNDFGPYRSRKHHTPWGDALNFDGRHSKHVRQFVIDNVLYWLDVYHLDGLRLDAVFCLHDDSPAPILDEIRQAVSECAKSTDRRLHLIAETNVYDDELLTQRDDRAAYDAIWCDCLMHSIHTQALPDLQLSGRDFRATGDLANALHYGHVYAGRAEARVPTPRTDQRPPADKLESLIVGLQTHDTVGNHPQGKRIHQLTSKSYQRAAAALALLYPGIPLLFMGEEVAAESPFPFFVDFEDARLRRAVEQGRRREYPQHTWGDVASPSNPETFELAKCYDRRLHDRAMLAWYRELLALRKQGLAEGWLASDRMTTGHDPGCDLFWLRFDCDNGRQVFIQARLAGSTQCAQVSVPLPGELLYASEPTPGVNQGQVFLGRHHAVISKCPSAGQFIFSI